MNGCVSIVYITTIKTIHHFFSLHIANNMLRRTCLIGVFMSIVAVHAFVTVPQSNPLIDPL